VALVALAVGVSACGRAPIEHEPPAPAVPPGWFEDVTAASGLNFEHDPGPTGTYFMPQSMGSGAACLDFDGDGLLDIYLLNLGGPGSTSTNRLFRQTAPGRFQDVTAGSGLDVAGHFHGVAVGDVNNDGKPDVLLTGFGTLKLFLNLGNGTFRDATEESGLANPCWGASAAFLDYDRDGWLDLVVVNYLDYDPKVECRSPEGVLDYCGPNSFGGTASKLFRNLRVTGAPGGPGVRFEDVSLASGIGTVRGPGLGVAVADFDGDGWPDIFIANDGKPNRLWINQKNGTFVDEATSRGVALNAAGHAYAGMGVAVGDVSNSGMLALYVTHLGSERNTLWRQGPRGQFRDRTTEAGLAAPKWRGTGFGALMADFNLDGALDIAVVNGKVFRGGPARNTNLGFWETYAEKNQLFVNDGAGKFKDASPENGVLCGYWNVGRGLVCADFDKDGAPDLLVTSLGGRARLFRNVAPNRGHWLCVRAIDPKRNRDSYGAEVLVRAGGVEYLRVVNPAESYLCSGSPLTLFGLGSAETVEWVRITWPDGPTGQTETFPGGSVDRTLTLARGEGKTP
jgi:hypothetical protein